MIYLFCLLCESRCSLYCIYVHVWLVGLRETSVPNVYT